MTLERDLAEGLPKFLTDYKIFVPFIILVRLAISFIFFAGGIGLIVYGIPMGIYYGLTLLFPSINFDFIIHKSLELFLTYGIIAALYYASKFYFKDQFKNSETVRAFQKWFLISACIVCTGIFGWIIGTSHTASEMLNSSMKLSTENGIVFFLVALIPILFGFINIINEKKEILNPQSKQNYSAGYDAYEEAKKLLVLTGAKRKDNEALLLLDKAIECGIEKAYADRAFILQGLNFHYDAITDFYNAIQLAKDDANLYFGRGHSRDIVGDYDGAVSDLQKAIEFSKIDNETNRIYNTADFITDGSWESATVFYELQLVTLLQNQKYSEGSMKEIYEKRIKEIKRRSN